MNRRALWRWARLPRPERRAASEAVLVLGLVSAGLRVFPPKLTGALVRRATSADAGSADDGEPVDMVVVAVERAARRVPGATCLAQALTAWMMLERRRTPAVVRIGASRRGDQLAAHAWLEHAGRIVLGEDQARRQVEFPPPP